MKYAKEKEIKPLLEKLFEKENLMESLERTSYTSALTSGIPKQETISTM